VAFFGSSLVSSYWNGAATYYRGLLRAMHSLGFDITFYEPDACGRQQHRDIDEPDWARVVVYENSHTGLAGALDDSRRADVLVKASGVGVFDRELEFAVLDRRSTALSVFWDLDAPATLERLAADPFDPFHELIPKYDVIFTDGGGDAVSRAYRSFGARECLPVYTAIDSSTHFAVAPDRRFASDLAFLGNRLPDREAHVDEFLLQAARAVPDCTFLLGGSGWDDKPLPANIRYLGHIYTADHNAFNSSPAAVLNISRESMARCGFFPATQLFEAAGTGACLISDPWEGLETFLEPGREILVAASGEDVARHLRDLTPASARAIGQAAKQRVLGSHTYAHRAAQVAALLVGHTVSI